VSGYIRYERLTSQSVSPVEKAASNRLAVMAVCERLFTVAEYNQLCADMGKGRVEFRMYDDGIVMTRKFPAAG